MKKPLTDAEAIASIPKLPYVQGSISWIPKRQMYMYKKSIGGERKACYAESVSKVMAEMSKLEKETQQQIKRKEIITLAEAMFQWLDLYKKPILKETSYDTLHKTIRTRIAEHPIGRLRLSAVDSDCIQAHLNSLNESLLSYSTIKKCYDALNDFYRNQTLQKKISLNPMLTVEMLHPEQILKSTKEIEFFAPKDIQKFEDRATTLLH